MPDHEGCRFVVNGDEFEVGPRHEVFPANGAAPFVGGVWLSPKELLEEIKKVPEHFRIALGFDDKLVENIKLELNQIVEEKFIDDLRYSWHQALINDDTDSDYSGLRQKHYMRGQLNRNDVRQLTLPVRRHMYELITHYTTAGRLSVQDSYINSYKRTVNSIEKISHSNVKEVMLITAWSIMIVYAPPGTPILNAPFIVDRITTVPA